MATKEELHALGLATLAEVRNYLYGKDSATFTKDWKALKGMDEDKKEIQSLVFAEIHGK